MTTNTTPRSDLEAVREMATHWLHRVNGSERDFPEALADLAAGACVRDALIAAESAREELCIEAVFGSGFDFGIAAAVAILDSPLSVDCERLKAAIGVASKTLRELAQSARDDMERVKSRSFDAAEQTLKQTAAHST